MKLCIFYSNLYLCHILNNKIYSVIPNAVRDPFPLGITDSSTPPAATLRMTSQGNQFSILNSQLSIKKRPMLLHRSFFLSLGICMLP